MRLPEIIRDIWIYNYEFIMVYPPPRNWCIPLCPQWKPNLGHWPRYMYSFAILCCQRLESAGENITWKLYSCGCTQSAKLPYSHAHKCTFDYKHTPLFGPCLTSKLSVTLWENTFGYRHTPPKTAKLVLISTVLMNARIRYNMGNYWFWCTLLWALTSWQVTLHPSNGCLQSLQP